MADTSQEVTEPGLQEHCLFIVSYLFVSWCMIERVRKFIDTDIWGISSGDVSPMRFFMYEILKVILLAVRFFTTKRVVSHAAALTYSSLLAIVPICAVVFAIARGFGYNKYIEVWFRDALSSQPDVADVIVGFVNSYLVHTRSGVFLGIGLIFMLYTVLMLVSNIEQTFNEIWQVKKSRSFFRTFTDYLAMFFLMPIFLVLSGGLTIFMATIAESTPDYLLLGPVIRFVIAASPYLFMSAVFVALYMFMPNTHVRFRNVIVPGLIAGIAMQALQYVYVNSQIFLSSYNAIYGSFAALPLFMLWVQISWTICLFGAELCYASQNLDYYAYDARTSDVSHRYRMLLCGILMSIICRRFDNGQEPLTAMQLSKEAGIPIRITNDLLYQLEDARMLIEIVSDEKGDNSRFVPAENVGHLSLGHMIDRLESLGKWRIDLSLSKRYSALLLKALKARSDYLRNCRDILLKDL